MKFLITLLTIVVAALVIVVVALNDRLNDQAERLYHTTRLANNTVEINRMICKNQNDLCTALSAKGTIIRAPWETPQYGWGEPFTDPQPKPIGLAESLMRYGLPASSR